MGKKTQELKQTAAAALATAKDLIIDQPTVLSVGLEVSGTADLIQNKFSQKAIEQMLKKHMGISVQRERKKPREVLEEATIRNLEGRVSLPPTAFKLAMISAATQIKLTKTMLRTSLFVVGNSIPITYESTIARMDVVGLGGPSHPPDVRFRPSFQGWKARLIIQFADHLSVPSVIDLLNRAGQVGVGEWRPEKNGPYGTFKVTRHIETARELGEVEQECAVALPPLRIPEWALEMEIDIQMLQKVFAAQETEAMKQPREKKKSVA